jgi:hypothetical protein
LIRRGQSGQVARESVTLGVMTRSTRKLVFIFAAIALSSPIRADAKSLAFTAKILCSAKSIKVQLKSAASTVTTVLPTNPSSLKSGKAKGCATIANLSKPPAALVPPANLKGLKSAYVISISLPSQENDIEFNLSYDWIVLQKKNGSWISGPLAQAGGLENSVENRVKLASASRVELVQTSSAEGETSEEKVVFVKSGASWVKQ